MPRIEMEQNTQEWLDWRKDKIGASDLPIILGLSPYSTPLQLWKRKLGFEQSPNETASQRFGKDNESHVRELLQQEYGVRIDPATYVHPELPWAIASLDGVDENGIIYEIKMANAEDHAMAKAGKVPTKYFPQTQWQLFVHDDAKLCRYTSMHKGEKVVVEVEPSEAYIIEILEEATTFKECLDSYTPPELTEQDYQPIDDPEFGKAANEWMKAKEMLDEAKKQEEYWRNQLIEHTDDSNCEGYGVRLTRTNRTGNIDWDKVCEKHGIDKSNLEEFRKPQIGYWKITITQ